MKFLVFFAFQFSIGLSVFAQMPQQDSTFGAHGKVDLGNVSFSNMRIDTGGRILITGRRTGVANPNLVIRRLLRNGIPDSSFATNGESYRLLSNSSNTTPGILSDGRVVVSDEYVAISTSGVRCFKGNEADSGFGTNGLIAFWGQNNVSFNGTYIDSNDRIFFPGEQISFSSLTDIFLACSKVGDTLLRYPSGYGRAHSYASDQRVLSAMTLGSDKKMLFAGKLGNWSGPHNLFIGRNDSTGSERDMAFNNGNAIEFPTVLISSIYDVSIAQLPNGKILCSHTRGLVQLLPNGVPDPEFGTNGIISTESDTHSIDMKGFTKLTNGKILACGTKNSRIAFQRFMPNGKIDSSFAVNGTFNPDVPGNGYRAVMTTRGDTVLAGNGNGLVQYVIGNETTEVQDQIQHEPPVLYPNPANEAVTIDRKGEILKILLIDALGREKEFKLIQKNQLDIRQLNSGIYWVKIHTLEGVVVMKLLKN